MTAAGEPAAADVEISVPPRPRPPALTLRQTAVLYVARRYYAHEGEPCSVEYIARRLLLSRARVRRLLEALVAKGFIEGTTKPRFER